MDLRNNQDDRPYRVTRNEYGAPHQQNDWENDTMSTQGYYREVLRNVTEQRWFPLAAVTVGVIVFGTLIGFAYRQGAQTTSNATTPLIQAENTPYKEKPQDAGGMDVPFQDAVVFDQLDKTQTAENGEKVENLLPPPEQPVDEPTKTADATATTAPADAPKADTAKPDTSKTATETAPPSAPKDNAEDKSVIADAAKPDATDSVAAKIAATEEAMKTKTSDTAKEVATATTTVKDNAVKTANAKADAVKTETTKSVDTAAVKMETTAPVAAKTIPAKAAVKTAVTTTPAKMNSVAPAAPTPAPAATSGSAKVQLGAFKDEAAARAAWASLQKQYAPHLNGVTPNYARADLGAKGVFYRVQGVNLSAAKAQSICKSINATKAGACIIPQ